ncbi:UNVERIFIED_CONTAM: Retrovirus-related Pol polyprotein from transposon TNT 1-94 [Sesamum calycinum]|uniref:Retrovirus-related Pol polyprotein from transposon TNT 1-94 n=1 Tax=Sesamum calycinum TaxID=2727403 RepID=A0AAW2L9F6_9LAMI
MHDTISDDLLHSPKIHLLDPVVPLRRSHRQSHPPPWLNDFISHSATSPLDSYTLTPSYSAFLAAFSTVQEPRCYKQANGCPQWEEAMRQELQALENNETWLVVDLPPGKKPIGSKWVFKTKPNPDGSVERYKAKLVAKGYNQVEGVDYFDIFSPVSKWLSVSVGKVCKLKRSLHGLKQASRQWNQELTSMLLQFGFLQSTHDHCLFVKNTAAGLLVLLTYVDDLLIASPSESLIIEVKTFLHDAFSIKDLGLARPTFTLCPWDLSSLLKFVHRPCQSHMDAAFHLVRYLKGCPDKGLFFPASNSSVLTGYFDVDWASCTDSHRSLTGYCVFLGNALISWRTKK